MSTGRQPARMRTLVEALETAGWAYQVTNGEDSAGHAYRTVDGVEPVGANTLYRSRMVRVRVTWHTRPTDGRSLRLFSAMSWRAYQGWRQQPVTALITELAGARWGGES